MKFIVPLIVFLLQLAVVNCRPKKNPPKEVGPLPVSSFSPGGQYIVLTFENGPHATITPKVLDILLQKGVHATFFVNGRKAIYQKRLIQRMIEEGHETANYGAHDKNATMTNYQQIRKIENIQFTSRLLYSFTNTIAHFYRPPSPTFATSALTQDIMSATNMTVVLYSIDLSHAMAPLSAATRQVVERSKPGDIVNLLDTTLDTVSILPDIIDILQKNSFEFVTLSQISSFPDDEPH